MVVGGGQEGDDQPDCADQKGKADELKCIGTHIQQESALLGEFEKCPLLVLKQVPAYGEDEAGKHGAEL